MNILIPHGWLKEYLQTNAAPKKIAECISLCGASVEKTEKTENDFIYDIEVTTNRVDMMSILGIAREVVAILPQFGIKARLKKDPTLKRSDLSLLKGRTLMKNKLKVIIKDKKLCPRFTAVVLDNIQIKPSPKIIQNRLKKADMRPLNNIIDISNYLMHELGQPVHTFDYDKIAEKTMILRESKKGERLVTLDGKKYILPGNDIIIEDGNKKLIDLCGIMGGENSCIDKKTKKVLLFVQNYEPYHIRKTSMSLGLRTQAASLFEKKIDPELAMPALLKGIQLIEKYAGGKVSSKIIDIYRKPYKPKTIKVPLQLIKQYLNIPIQSNKVIKILNSLGFKSQITKHQSQITVVVPSWRAHDINIPEDLIEEVARIYGYHNLPSLIMDTPIPTNYPKENFDLEYKIKTYLAGMGLTELYTNSLISRKLAKDSKKEINQHLKIKNALSEEWLYLRRSLIPSHLNAIKDNSNQKHLQFFEMANVYHPEKRKLPKEELQLIISSTQDFLKVKGWLELLLKKLYINASFLPKEILLLKNNKSAEILIGKEVIGKIGSANLPQNYPYKEINFIIIKIKKLFKFAEKYPKYQAIPKYPPIIEDLSFLIGPEVHYSGIVQLIKSVSSIIQSIELVDSYKPSDSEGKNSLAVRITYQNPKRNLTNKEVSKIRKKIVLKLKKQNIILKGKS